MKTGKSNMKKKITKDESWKMFDQIAGSYDRVNHILSLNIDVYWRNKVVEYAPSHGFELVDLATGTGDLLLTLLENCPQIKQATGIDLSQQMLRIGEKKVYDKGYYEKTEMKVGNAGKLHLKKKCCDMVSMAFGIRNTPDPLTTLKEIYRILRPNGVAAILEFSMPKNFLIRSVYVTYFRFILPWLGGLISKNYRAYRYLNTSVEEFPYGDKFRDLMEQAELVNIEIIPLTFGIATLYIGRKS